MKICFYYYTPAPNKFGDPKEIFALYCRCFPAMGVHAGVYEPLFGKEVGTEDLMPPYYRAYFHCEFGEPRDEVVKDGDGCDVYQLVHPDVNVQAIEEKLAEFKDGYTYQQPLLWIFLKFCENTNHFWFLKYDYAFRWKIGYGLDIKTPKAAVINTKCFAPSDDRHFDIDSPIFWSRAFDCSSFVAWMIVWGLINGGRPGLKDFLKEDYRRVNAIDCLSPGMLLWWLKKERFLEFKDAIHVGA